MRSIHFILIAAAFLTACTTTETPPSSKPKPESKIVYYRSYENGKSAFTRISKQINPIATSICKEQSKDLPEKFCDFQFKINTDPRQPPNAFQSINRAGQPVVTFNHNMLRAVKNDHEIAFILGHEAGHQIARHLLKKRRNAMTGAIMGSIILGGAGIDPQMAADLGSAIGAQRYSKEFELEADRLGAYIAYRAGYDPRIGAKSFQRFGTETASALSTHPASPDRIRTVNKAYAQIRNGTFKLN